MPEQLLSSYFEKGFFAAVGFICTAALTAVGLHAKQDKDFREKIHRKVDDRVESLHEKIDDHARYVNQNHPDNREFKLMMKTMDTQFKSMNGRLGSVDRELKAIREKI